MHIKREQIPLLVLMAAVLLVFTIIFSFRRNYEFLMYVGVIVFFLFLILYTNKKVDYPLSVLWGLSAWAILHLVGGGIFIGGKKVYEIMLIPLVGEPYLIFKYDQFVHIIGFGVATLLMYHLIKPVIKTDSNKHVALLIVVAMAGLGVGAINEIIEFMATVVIPETGVGGYENTSLDLISDLIGALIAVMYIKKFELKNNLTQELRL